MASRDPKRVKAALMHQGEPAAHPDTVLRTVDEPAEVAPLRAALRQMLPGVADAPLAGSEDAERLWDAMFDWVATRPDLDAQRVAVVGGSTGGYWAAKLAVTERTRLAGQQLDRVQDRWRVAPACRRVAEAGFELDHRG